MQMFSRVISNTCRWGVTATLVFTVALAAEAGVRWRPGTEQVRLIAPNLTGPMSGIVVNTINEYTGEKYGWRLPVAQADSGAVLNIAAGNAQNNPLIDRKSVV